jgi:tetratricopeptide (TPR) repeat protein
MKAFDLARTATDAELARYTKRIGLLLVVGAIAFAAIYVADRWRPTTPPIADQQITALEEAVRTSPNDIAVRGSLADAYTARGRFEEAITQYDVIIAAGVSLEPAHLGRARALVGLSRLDEAAVDFGRVVEIAGAGEMAHVDLSLAAAYYGLASIAMQQGRPADAITNLEAALEISRSDADALHLLGTAFNATGQHDKAITVLRAAVAFVPTGWGEPYAALAEAYRAGGREALAAWATAMVDATSGIAERVAAAETALTGLLDGDAELDATLGLALIHETRGDNAGAVEWYSKALALDPDNSTARLGLARVGPMPTTEGTGS